jgi:hypothetical protein
VTVLWPAGGPGQVDYETLREAAVSGVCLATPEALCFARVGLAGIILRPNARQVLVASLHGATRPAWTPYEDPRHEVLATAYELLLVGADEAARLEEPTGVEAS